MDRLKKILQWIGMVALFIIPIMISFLIGQQRGIRKAQSEFKVDTLIVDHWDTIRVSKPIYVSQRIVDTMWLPLPAPKDSLPDSIDHIVIPKEQAYYRDSTYEAWVSGYRPALDSINVFNHSQTIYIDRVEQIKRKTHWGIGIQVGYGAYVQNRQVGVAPYVGVGLSYNILSW